MASVEQAVRLGQPPADVWNFVVRPENFPHYVAGYRDGAVLSDVQEGLGLRFRWHASVFSWSVESIEEVVEWDPPRRVGFRGEMAGVGFRSAMILEPVLSGTTFTVRIEFESPLPVVNGVLDRLVLGPIVRRHVRESLDKLRRWDAARRS